MKWLLLWSLTALAAPPAPGPSMCFDGAKIVERESSEKVSDAERACSKSDDCTFVADVCETCAVAVNKTSKAAVQNRIQGRQSAIRCRRGAPMAASSPCWNGKCAVSKALPKVKPKHKRRVRRRHRRR